MRKLFISVICLLILVTPVSSFAANKALIVAVSDYPNLPDNLKLDGPKNDAVMIKEYLEKNSNLGFRGNIKVLADNVEGAQLPTKKAITDSMKNLAEKAEKGDFIYLHFSGHGSRQPVTKLDESETDGLDELFLPYDIGSWNDSIGEVENALIDDEIGKLINGIRARGAFVWAVFDSCHSGTVTRSASTNDGIKMRKVSTDALGIPEAAMKKAAKNTIITRGSNKKDTNLGDLNNSEVDQGGFVAFYAAQTSEQTPEMRLPAGKKGRKPHGLFSFTLLQVISENPTITYRQAAQEMLQRYSAKYMDIPTPMFEGDLDKIIFNIDGAAAKNSNNQWRTEKSEDSLLLSAGHLNRISEGSVLGLLKSPTDKTIDAIGYAKVLNAENFESKLELVEFNAKPKTKLQDLPEGIFARLIVRKYDYNIKVLKPKTTSNELLNKVLKEVEDSKDSALKIEFVKAGEASDIKLILQDNHLWFAPVTGVVIAEGVNKTPSINLVDKDEKTLKYTLFDNLSRISKVLNLLKVGADVGAVNSDVEVALKAKRKGSSELAEVKEEEVPDFFAGDEVHIKVKNVSGQPIDLNVLFIGSDYSISHWFSGRVLAGDALEKGLFKINADSIGTERLLIISLKVKPETMIQDLSFLSQDSLQKTRGAELQGDLWLKLSDAVFGSKYTRSTNSKIDEERNSNSSIIEFKIRTNK